MEEYEEHAHGTHILDSKNEYVEIAIAEGSPVGHLVVDGLMRHHPSHINTGKETAEREQHVGRKEIEEIEKRLSEELQFGNGTQRQGAKSAGNHSQHRHDAGPMAASHTELFAYKGRRRLVHGDDAGEGSQYQKDVEKDSDDIAHHRTAAKAC